MNLKGTTRFCDGFAVENSNSIIIQAFIYLPSGAFHAIG